MSRVDVRSIRRRQILDAAERLAAQKGWTETTIADICQVANVSTGVVTRHFESKDEIMLAALEDVLEQFQAQLKPFLGSESPLAENIYQVFSQVVTSQATLPQLLLHSFATSISRPEIAERLHTFFSNLRQQHTADLELQLDQKGIVGTDRVILINLLYNLAFGLISSRVTLGSDLSLEQLAFHCSNMLLKYFDLPQEAKE